MDLARVAKLLDGALERRAAVAEVSDAYRVANGAADDLPGMTLDRYAGHWQLQIFDDALWGDRRALCETVAERFSPKALVAKRRTSPDGSSLEHAETEWFLGEESPRAVVREGRAKLAVDLSDGVNPGLFLDMRDHRLRFGAEMRGRRFLNLFCYTGSFGVHAHLGGAAALKQVDISAKILDRARLNLRLNGRRSPRQEFSRWDSLEFLAWAAKKGLRYDAVVVDPPTFSKNKGKTFRVERDLPGLVSGAAALLAPGGLLLFGTNCSVISVDRLGRTVRDVLSSRGRASRPLFSGGQGADFPEIAGAKTSHLAAVALEVR
ncbi:MAG: class I SAM-dependent rRNA methyltransferase [Fibrobacterales bacterium]|nr:class I SAM-dependent rRNA methyltransferase [Fibrobacterales bacterium]